MCNKQISKIIHIICVCITLLCGILILLYHCIHPDGQLHMDHCYIFQYLHIYCFGCGGTRAVEAFLQLKLWKSFLYHPIVIYIAILSLWETIKNNKLILHISKRSFQLFRTRNFYIALIIVVLQMVAKNIIYLCFHIPLDQVVSYLVK